MRRKTKKNNESLDDLSLSDRLLKIRDESLYEKLSYYNSKNNKNNIEYLNLMSKRYFKEEICTSVFNKNMVFENLKILKISGIVFSDDKKIKLPSCIETLECNDCEHIINNCDLSNKLKLTRICCEGNQLYDVDELPPNLIYLDISSNKLNRLVNLPETIEYLDCSFNKERLFIPNTSLKNIKRIISDIKPLSNLSGLMHLENLTIVTERKYNYGNELVNILDTKKMDKNMHESNLKKILIANTECYNPCYLPKKLAMLLIESSVVKCANNLNCQLKILILMNSTLSCNSIYYPSSMTIIHKLYDDGFDPDLDSMYSKNKKFNFYYNLPNSINAMTICESYNSKLSNKIKFPFKLTNVNADKNFSNNKKFKNIKIMNYHELIKHEISNGIYDKD
jgi:hypothetical protein